MKQQTFVSRIKHNAPYTTSTKLITNGPTITTKADDLMTYSAPSCPASIRSSRGFSFFHALGIWRQRQHLKALDASRLDDIRVSRADAEHEAARPIWDVPTTWRNYLRQAKRNCAKSCRSF